MKKLLKGIRSAEAALAGTLLGVMTVVTFVAAVNRFTLKIPMPWSEELVRYLLLWDSILAAAYGLSVNAHVGIDVITSNLKPAACRAIKVVTCVLALVFLCVMFYFGLKLTINGMPQKSPAMQISMALVNACLPVGAVCMALEFIDQLLDTLIPARSGMAEQ